MSQAAIVERVPGELVLSGVIDHASGPLLREQGRRLIQGGTTALVLDCSAISKSNSVGLSLLLAFMRDARQAGRELHIRALPEELREMAQVSALLELLPIAS
ncbi:Phospholipid transport system transporter-binding protein [Pseudomonas sp. 8Z]|uniref:STAS domain-containing protein n=1 Tax=Pseudomonas sp. 8Z TaxID=2653166 RepID=UPI0012F01A69|nr:STAS domain-containing protein [Pseudomonas sp. 8Z]VXD02992.1 Phospholipid transport system transporter-binding protein [Pseudomonas sp. 8Z]